MPAESQTDLLTKYEKNNFSVASRHNGEYSALPSWSDAGLLNKISCLAAALGVNKFIVVIVMNLVTLCCAT